MGTITSSGDYVIHIGTSSSSPAGWKFVLNQDAQAPTIEVLDSGEVKVTGCELIIDNTTPLTFQAATNGTDLLHVLQQYAVNPILIVHDDGLVDISNVDLIIYSSTASRPPGAQDGDLMMNGGGTPQLQYRDGGTWVGITLTS